MQNKKLRVLSFGAGAIGGYLGACLGLQGHEISFLERPYNITGLKANGIYLTVDSQTRHLANGNFFPSIREALANGPYDFAIFALKSYDTQAALESLKGFEQDMPPVLCLQNGVDNEASIAEHVGEDKVIYGTVTTSIGKPALGQLVLERQRGIGIGAGHPLSQRITDAMNQSELNARLYIDPRAIKWSKLLTNVLAIAQCAILDRSPQQILSAFATYQVEIEQLREALKVMKALNLNVFDLPGTPVRALAFGAKWLPMRISQPIILRVAGSGRGNKMPSLHIDRFGGRKRSEVQWLNGAVVQWGKNMGIETPVNQDLAVKLTHLVKNA